MSKAQLVITAVVLEGRSKSDGFELTGTVGRSFT